MRYAYIDIEASEGRSICSIGYVVADEEFNILERDDILINPEATFRTAPYGRKKSDRGIVLAYPPATFRKNPNFKRAYPTVRALLERDDATIMGFSHLNDIRYLHRAAKRYKLEPPTYSFFEIQDFYCKAVANSPESLSLERILAKLDISFDGYALHKSVDDAEMSMLIFRKICETSGLSPSETLAKYPRYVGRCDGFEVSYGGAGSKNKTDILVRRYANAAVCSYLSSVRLSPDPSNAYSGKAVCADKRLAFADRRFCINLIAVLAAHGVRFSQSVKGADYYIRFSPEEGSDSRDRLSNLRCDPKAKRLEVLDADAFLASFGESIESVRNLNDAKTEKRIRNIERNIERIKTESQTSDDAPNAADV